MAIHRCPGDHLYLACDGVDPTHGRDCTFHGPTQHGLTEDEFLEYAAELGWDIDEFGHYCPLHTIHDCVECDAPTRSRIGAYYYCKEHFPFRTGGPD